MTITKVTKKTAGRVFHNLLMILCLSGFILTWNQCSPEKNAEGDKLPKDAVVIGDNLKVRVVPNVSAAIIDTLPTGAKVQIKRRSIDKFKIGRQEDYWYKIVTEDGLEGWTFGSYLSIGLDADKTKKEIEETRNKKIEEDLPGKWFAAAQDGTMYNSFLQFYSSGKIEFGTGQEISGTAKYGLVHNSADTTVNLVDVKSPPYTNLIISIIGDSLVMKGESGGREFSFKKTEGGWKFKDVKKSPPHE